MEDGSCGGNDDGVYSLNVGSFMVCEMCRVMKWKRRFRGGVI